LEVGKRTVAARQYINTLEQPFQEKFLATKQTYQLQQTAIDQLRKFASKYVIVAFSAAWCKDCATVIPVLALINEATELEVRVLGV
jgi:thiol-disulfide isomerase/thioredoxin